MTLRPGLKFNANGRGWGRSLGSESPALLIRVQHSNRETTLINLSGSTLTVTNSSGQFKKELTPAEVARLRELVGEPPARN